MADIKKLKIGSNGPIRSDDVQSDYSPLMILKTLRILNFKKGIT